MSGPEAPAPVRMSRVEAIHRLGGGGWLRALRRGRLVAVREVGIPYRLMSVIVASGGERRVSTLAVDAATGSLDPYRLEPPEAAAVLETETAQTLPARVPPEELRHRCIEQVRRQVYRSGFFRLRGDLRIDAVDTGRVAVMPYWVGVYARGDRLSIDVLSSLRRQWEGPKVRDVILHWLASGAGEGRDPRRSAGPSVAAPA
jgi:hypothetical protein